MMMVVSMRMRGDGAVRVHHGMARNGRQGEFSLHPLNHRIKPNFIAEVSEQEWPLSAHLAGVPFHDFQ
jgi:hypothetical protein